MDARFDTDRLATISDETLTGLRDAFARAGYDASATAACEAIAPRLLDGVRVPAVLHELSRRGDVRSTLAALFAYDGPVPRTAAVAALGETVVAALCEAGVLRGDQTVRSRLRVQPYYGMWIASTPFEVDVDPVMGPGATTEELARSLAFDGVGSLLDIGCGAGTLALLARRAGVAEVVGVDIDPRAIAFAHFNGRLNQLTCEWHVGDLAAPVRGRRFDAIVSQPAYVARPDDGDTVTFLHGGARGDELAQRLLGQLFDGLAEGGRAWVLFDATASDGAALVEWIQAAVGARPLELAVVAMRGADAVMQSIAYASLEDRELGPRYREQQRRYRDHFARLGVERVRHTLLFARRGRDQGRLVMLEPGALVGFEASALMALIDGAAAAGASDDALLSMTVRPSPVALLVHEQSLGDDGGDKVFVRFRDGAGVDRELSETSTLLLTSIRDTANLVDALALHADTLGVDVDDIEQDALAFIRDGLRTGLLVCAPPPGQPS
ncbi:MAG: methyltransferase [Deltaproteobacteria bacterium]|nr:methyltransferase [Deltaproteobacteria bacterium]